MSVSGRKWMRRAAASVTLIAAVALFALAASAARA